MATSPNLRSISVLVCEGSVCSSCDLITMKVRVSENKTAPAAPIKKGKVRKSREDDFEVSAYLDKLRHLLPHGDSPCPRQKESSRLEVIQGVIDYIGDLQEALEADKRTMDLLEFETSSITLAA